MPVKAWLSNGTPIDATSDTRVVSRVPKKSSASMFNWAMSLLSLSFMELAAMVDV